MAIKVTISQLTIEGSGDVAASMRALSGFLDAMLATTGQVEVEATTAAPARVDTPQAAPAGPMGRAVAAGQVVQVSPLASLANATMDRDHGPTCGGVPLTGAIAAARAVVPLRNEKLIALYWRRVRRLEELFSLSSTAARELYAKIKYQL